ncbi:MAG: 2-isopropylmalate synthase [Thalassolituus sp.]|jgi:2-isopropylmalate synthase|tara:strand:- start:169 stop:1854 length:1686 start_codon:yes stop_codon:yes gene_type:complete
MTQPVNPEFNHSKYRAFPKVQLTDRTWPDQALTAAPLWCSVDLRDGNQALIDPMTVEQKKQMWALLVRMGFKEIEIGFPSASQPDFDFARWLIEARQIPSDVTVQVLVQARDELIERTYEALRGVRRAVVHVYNSTSPVQREKVFGVDKQGIINIARHGAEKVMTEAKKYPDTEWVFQYSPESFSSTEVEFATEVCSAVIDVWQPTPDNKAIINLPATVESAMPNIFADQIEWFCRHVNRRDSITVSIHTHNDRGCGVAAAELALLAGADRIEGTLLGNGERTGNMDIVTMAMNLYSQGIDPELDISIADDIIATVESCTNIKTHPRHPWLGELVYTAFSGSHQDAIRKCLAVQKDEDFWDVAYLPIDPQDIGRTYQSVIRVNSQSGKGGASYIVEQALGVTLPRWMQIELAQHIQNAAESQARELNSDEIVEIFTQSFMPRTGHYALDSYQTEHDSQHHSIQASLLSATSTISLHGQGSGSLSAFTDALHKATGIDIQVVQFEEQALSEGSDAQAISFVQISMQGQRFTAAGRDNDTLAASLQSIINAVNIAINNGVKAA